MRTGHPRGRGCDELASGRHVELFDRDLRAVDVALGDDFGCAITMDDAIACWGTNSRGQLGIGSRTPCLTPVMTLL